MLFDQEYKVGFLHIPKTAGTSIKRTMISTFPHCFHVFQGHFHRFGVEIRDWILGAESFYKLRWFAGTRHPVEAMYSSYKRSLQVANDKPLSEFRPGYRKFLEHTLECKDFEQHVREKWIADDDQNIKKGGFYYTYCCDWDGEPLPVRILHFDRLQEDWQSLLDDWQLPQMHLENLNVSNEPFNREEVPDGLYDDIMAYCWKDVEKFGYQ